MIRPTTKSVDASVLLARALTPEPMRPGWPASLAMARSALPYDRLLGIDERLRHAAARLADYKVPQFVAIREEPLPRNAAGKVVKDQLRQQVTWGKSLR